MPQLDGLRAIAVALVVAYHLLQPIHTGGWLGVHVFFVLSGYLITSLLLRDLHQAGQIRLKRFYALRLLRLYPPMIVALLVLLPPGILTSSRPLWYLVDNAVAATYTTNIFITITGHFTDGWAHTWTLAMEEQFYLVWPIVLLVIFRLFPQNRVGILGVLLLAAGSTAGLLATYDPAKAYYNPAWNCGGLLIGCVMAMTRESWQSWAVGRASGIVGALILLGAWIAGAFNILGAWPVVPAIVGSALVVGHLSRGGFLSKPLSARYVVSAGRISYELYLWHYPLLYVALALFPESGPIRAAFVLATAVPLSWLSHRFVTTPLTRRMKPRVDGYFASRTVNRIVP